MTVPLLFHLFKKNRHSASMENQVPEDVIKDRFDRLTKAWHDKASEASARFTGSVQKVLVRRK